ncbi:MAG: LysR family transcriptional regulator, partial [Thermoleophilaceae bacterium]|nr:LysR family transcriptional regulator [Thermoleophilaceae bacterium]
MLDVKQLRVLKAVAEQGSFSAAAEALSYTQPAISQQIAALEKSAGTTLVDRTSRGVHLTDAGRALVDHAQVVLARLAAAEAELDAIAGVRGGRVRLAAFPTAGASLLPPAVALFSERHPEVELTFVEHDPEPALQMLRAAELEVALVFQFHDLSEPERERLYGGIELHQLVSDPMYLALPRNHPLAHKPRVRLQDVADETWIQEGDPRNPCGRLHYSACTAAGFE